jgi:hypothetical protein
MALRRAQMPAELAPQGAGVGGGISPVRAGGQVG